MLRSVLLAATVAVLLADLTASAQQPAPPVTAPATDIGPLEPFNFMAMGDMPYRVPDDYARFDRLIAAINAAKPAFSIHVGDIKASSEPCTDEYFRSIYNRFQRFENPLIYTPGDNEWTDCHRERAGRYDPRERLAKLREIFFADATKSLGKSTLPVVSQGRKSQAFARYVENTRFWKNGVLFVQVHVVGSNNGFEVTDPQAAVEYHERNKANIAWIDESAKHAADAQAKAIVWSMQSNLYDIRQKFPAMPLASGHVATVQALERAARTFPKPMLLVQGDEHQFEIDIFKGTNYKPVPRVLRLQVMGAEHVHAVRVSVDPNSPGVFGFTPFLVPDNGPH